MDQESSAVPPVDTDAELETLQKLANIAGDVTSLVTLKTPKPAAGAGVAGAGPSTSTAVAARRHAAAATMRFIATPVQVVSRRRSSTLSFTRSVCGSLPRTAMSLLLCEP